MKSEFPKEGPHKFFGPYDSFPLVNIERTNGECILHITPSNISYSKKEPEKDNKRIVYSDEIWNNMSIWQKIGFFCFIYDIPDMIEVDNEEKKEKSIEDKVKDSSLMESHEKEVVGQKESYKGFNGFRIEIGLNNKYDVIGYKAIATKE